MAVAEGHRSNSGKYLVIYAIILVIAALQFVIAYSNVSPGQMFTRMLILACVEAAFALLFFMHLADNRGLMWFVVIFTVAVILGMQYGWTDSFRLLDGVRWARKSRESNPPALACLAFCRNHRWLAAPRRFAGLLPELRSLLHAGRARRCEDDPGAEERHSDSCHPSYTRIRWHDFCGVSQAESGTASRVWQPGCTRLVR